MVWYRLVSGSATDAAESVLPSQTDTAEATANAIEDVQSITSLMHLPSWVGRLIFIVLVVLITWQVQRLVNRSFRRMVAGVRASGAGSGTLLSFVHNIVRVLIYFFAGLIIVYSIPGAKSMMNMLLASGGVIALILGVAAQDIMSNIAGGVMILSFKPFALGDFVTYVDKNISGVVEEINMRHTVIRTPQNKRVIVPNGLINQSVVENANYGDLRVCEFYEVGITYESDMDAAIQALREEVTANPHYLDTRTKEQIDAGEPLVQVRVMELGDSAVIVRAWLWAKDITEMMYLKCGLNESVKKRFDRDGIDFAYPHMMIVKKETD